MTVRVFARAKINLALHVTGQRPDGYHLLDSLVMFADVGDYVGVGPGDGVSLRVTGAEGAGVPVDGSNSILQAAAFTGQDNVAFTLEKNLPSAAGIGGGSADCAAALEALARLRGIEIPADVLALGADVPVCRRSRATRMRGIGERLDPLDGVPQVYCILVNPRVAVSTPMVFKALKTRDNPPMPQVIPGFGDAADFAAWLAEQRNDLEPAAITLQPVIGQVLAKLTGITGQLLVRMSGSGATCFALFADGAQAGRGARALKQARPDWWVVAGALR
jgi:4-diphosphocytidyl-2-C-methyl-D-erythritol kinase